jgi:phosphatidylserine/phosphatidylglycerophosphate/cardiolipin synthase-like enzyme
MKKLLHDKLRSAKKSIYIHTHQFNDEEMLEILDQKVKQGVEVKIINGTNKLVKEHNKSYFFQNKSLKDLHSKYMIIDKQMLIWGTSNYTTTGYNNLWEMTFIHQDPKLIEEFIKRFKAAEIIIKNGL